MEFEGNQPIANVVAQINRASEFLGGPARCTVESVIVRAAEQWFNHVTLIRVRLASGLRQEEDALELRSVTLLRLQQDLEREISVDEFMGLALRWQELVGLPERRILQEMTTVTRRCSDVRDAARWPSWDCYLHERPSSNGPFAAAPGPYRHPTRKFFARSLADVTVRWFAMDDWSNQVNVQQQYRLMLEDRRGRLTGVRASETGVTISVSSLNNEVLCCAVEVKAPAERQTTAEAEVASGDVSIALDLRDKERFEVLLTAADGERLDFYDETSSGWATWGPEHAVLRQRPPELGQASLIVPALADLAVGWNDRLASAPHGQDRASTGLHDKSQTVQDRGTVLPPGVYKHTRGFVERLAKQINRSYEENIFDGAAILMRRLEEVLLILAYQHLRIDDQIRDEKGHYLMLEGIVANALGNPTLNLSRGARKGIGVFRKLGNHSAHQIAYTCRREYIEEKIDDYRALVDELLHKAGIRS